MAENSEDKGFKIQDKRHFRQREDGSIEEMKAETTGEEKVKSEVKQEKIDSESKQENKGQQPPPLPQINFPSFILSLSTSALVHLGEIPDPLSKKKQKNLPFAKQTIDILEILKDKTKGNLEKEEEGLLDNLLYDLRMKYVQEAKS